MKIPEFIEFYGPLPGKYELWDGEPVLMAGSTARHALVGVNIVSALRAKLRGTGCLPFNSDMLLSIGGENGRLPDVATYCDRRDLDDPSALSFERPSVIFEVLSSTTLRADRGAKLHEYQTIPSVCTIVYVDSDLERLETWERMGANERRNIQHSAGADLVLTQPAVTLGADEIFARV